MRLFKRKSERRDYTSALTTALEAAASARVRSTAVSAVLAPVGVICRAFAAAEIRSDTLPEAARILGPRTLYDAVRQVLLSGEWIGVLRGSPPARLAPLAAGAHLAPVGTDDPMTWRYSGSLVTPAGPVAGEWPATTVVHLTFATHPDRPYAGIGPIQSAAISVGLAAGLVDALQTETTIPVMGILPVPEGLSEPELQALRTDIRSSRGGVLTPEAKGGQGMPGTTMEWKPSKMQPAPNAETVRLHEQLSAEFSGLFGVPPSLLNRLPIPGAAQREAWRQLMYATLRPLALRFQEELRWKLDAPDLEISFDRLAASDIMGRARAWRGLVGREAVMDREQADRLVGFRQ